MVFSEEEKETCYEVVKKEIELKGEMSLMNKIDSIVDDILRITYSKGGDFGESTLRLMASGYFSHEMYIKYL